YLPVHSLCAGLPSPSVPSTVTFTPSLVVSYVTVVNFGAPPGTFDFAPFNFHIPSCGSAAKHTAPTRHTRTVSRIVLAFIHTPNLSPFRVLLGWLGIHLNRELRGCGRDFRNPIFRSSALTAPWLR